MKEKYDVVIVGTGVAERLQHFTCLSMEMHVLDDHKR